MSRLFILQKFRIDFLDNNPLISLFYKRWNKLPAYSRSFRIYLIIELPEKRSTTLSMKVEKEERIKVSLQ